jgi:hypothetical protein
VRWVWLFGAWSCVELCGGVVKSAPELVGGQGPEEAPDTADSGGPAVARAERVVVLVMDGARIDETFGLDDDMVSDAQGVDTDGDGEPDAVGDVATNELFVSFKAAMLPIGTLVRPGYAAGIPITAPGHCDLLTGARQPYGHFPTPDIGGWYRPDLPTLYESVLRADPSAGLYLVSNSEHLRSLDHSAYPGVGDADGASFDFLTDAEEPDQPEERDEAVVDRVLEQLQAGARVVVANLHAMDRAGHFNSQKWAYADRVEQMSTPIVSFWQAVEADEALAGKTMLVVTADHGRHRWGDEAETRLEGQPESRRPDYRNHGDQCAGCRQLPMYLVGPGIQAGAVLDTTYTLDDVGRTLAYALGVEAPYATGVVMADAFTDGATDAVDRSGSAWVAAAGDHELTQEFAADPAERSTIVADGVTVSTGATIAEGPALYDGDAGTVACWRELTFLVGSSEIDWPWSPHCAALTGSSWEDIGFPLDTVWAWWVPALADDGDGNMLAAAVDNPNATTYSSDLAQVRLFRWNASQSWEEDADTAQGLIYPTGLAVLAEGGTNWVAVATSDTGPAGSEDPERYTRHVELYAVDWPAAGQTWTLTWRAYAGECPASANCPSDTPSEDTEGHVFGRMENPALATADGNVALAFNAWSTEVGNTILGVADPTGSDPEIVRLDDSGRVFGHIPPVWSDGEVVWARLADAETVEVCRAAIGGSADCTDTGRSRILGLSAGSGGVVASLDTGLGAWSVESVTW